MEKRQSFKQMVLQQLDVQTQKQMNIDTDLTPFTKTNSKWSTDFCVKCKTIKLLEGNTEENIDDLGFGDDSSDIISKAQSLKRKKKRIIS